MPSASSIRSSHGTGAHANIGPRYNNKAAAYRYEEWLPQSGETPAAFPIFDLLPLRNVGPNIREEDLITDVYLPLK
jgi:AraC family transcriptional regulator